MKLSSVCECETGILEMATQCANVKHASVAIKIDKKWIYHLNLMCVAVNGPASSPLYHFGVVNLGFPEQVIPKSEPWLHIRIIRTINLYSAIRSWLQSQRYRYGNIKYRATRHIIIAVHSNCVSHYVKSITSHTARDCNPLLWCYWSVSYTHLTLPTKRIV